MGVNMFRLHKRRALMSSRARIAGTITVALTPCSIPGKEELLFNLPRDKMELGMGMCYEPDYKANQMRRNQRACARAGASLLQSLS